MGQRQISGLYYITHIDNVPSVLKWGILSHARVEKEQIKYTAIYNKEIVANRRSRQVPGGRNLWEFANLYFQPRNPMLYRVLCEQSVDNIAIIAVKPDILNQPDVFISTGNAAHSASEILPAGNPGKALSLMREVGNMEWWKEEDGSKRKIMMECLVPAGVSRDFIQAIYVASHETADKLKPLLQDISVIPVLQDISVIPEPKMFFRPFRKKDLTQYLSVVEGDMFFSRMQTLTISVNCVSVMGKGLASRAKYQFPDVYVEYQDLCRKRILQMGKPYLYKREKSFDYQLADEPATLSNGNSDTWFLLFPTKRHWRERADINGIEQGLKWLVQNYIKEGIKSLAVPALGCGLGRLEWQEVGPLLCRYLKDLSVNVWIYLPAEKKIPDELITKEFLLSKRQ